MVTKPIIGIVTRVYQQDGRCYADLMACWSNVFNKDQAKLIKSFPIPLEFYRDYFEEVQEANKKRSEKDVIFIGELEVKLSVEDKPPWE